MRATTPEEYWDSVEEKSRNSDNVAKKQIIMSKILRHQLINRSVLEIGCGRGLISGAINTILMGRWQYLGTDISQNFCDSAAKSYGLNTIKTDILHLPNQRFNYIFMFDVLEHIPKTDMMNGFRQINKVLLPYGSIFINNPFLNNICLHDKNFDFNFTLSELDELCAATNTEVQCFEPYAVNHIKRVNGERLTQLCKYTWIELGR